MLCFIGHHGLHHVFAYTANLESVHAFVVVLRFHILLGKSLECGFGVAAGSGCHAPCTDRCTN